MMNPHNIVDAETVHDDLPTDLVYTTRRKHVHGIKQFFRGMGYPLRAIGFMGRYRLWHLAIVAVLVNIALLAALICTVWYFLWPWAQDMHNVFTAYISHSNYPFLAGFITQITYVITCLLVLPLACILAAGLVLLCGQTVASPFLDILSERVECLVLMQKPQAFGLRRLLDCIFLALGDLVWGLAYLIIRYLPLFLFSFIPVIGPILWLYVSAMVLSQECMGFALARHMVSYRGRWAIVLQNRWYCFGLGVSLSVLMFFPGMNLLMLPLAVVAGTLLYCDLAKEGLLRLPDRNAMVG